MKKNFKNIIRGRAPILLDFHASWCGPCQTMEPIFADLKKAYGNRLKLIKIDVDKNKTLALSFGIRSVPTTVLYVDGEQVWKQSGLLSKRDIRQVVDQYQA